jgi:predicted RNA binding protein YcfA (HicA-like mRNA interferase family)
VPKKYPTLKLSEVKSILESLRFTLKHKVGSHSQWEHEKDANHPRSVVTLDEAEREFDAYLIKSMIEQSNRSRDEFYGATKKTAKRASVPHLKRLEVDE